MRKKECSTVLLPNELLDQALVDKQGIEWCLEEKTEHVLGVFPKKRLEMSPRGSLTEALPLIVRNTLETTLNAWMHNNVWNLVRSMLERTRPDLEQILTTGERNIRMELIKKIGADGEAFMRPLLEECFAEIKRFLEQEDREQGKTTNGIRSSGMLPPGTRFVWETKTEYEHITLFCIEEPPQRRTVKISGMRLRLSFPWIYFFVSFINNRFYQFMAFFRSTPVESEEDAIFLPSLPNCSGGDVCLGDRPDPSPQDKDWHERLISHFWQSEFLLSHGHDYKAYLKEGLTGARFFRNWEEMSEKNPETIVAFPWIQYPHSIRTLVEKKFAGGIQYANRRKARFEAALQTTKDLMTERFRETLEELLYNLEARFTVPTDLTERTQKRLDTISGEGKIELMQELKEISTQLLNALISALVETPYYSKKGEH